MGVKSTLGEHGLRPQKKWGQHFLTDPRILESIADAAEVNSSDTILEIGPGLGHLTRVLARRAQQLVAVEVDRELAAKLTTELAETKNAQVVQGDILDAEPVEWLHRVGIKGTPEFKIVANLPYYITSAILRHVLEAAHKPRVIVVMVQREVAQRMAARPPEMNLLAVSVQFFARVRIARTIAAGAFYPPPKVESAVVRLDVFDQPLFPEVNPTRFFKIVHAGFGEKRKQLRNALARGLALDPAVVTIALHRAKVDPTRRAETLSLEEWYALDHELNSSTIV